VIHPNLAWGTRFSTAATPGDAEDETQVIGGPLQENDAQAQGGSCEGGLNLATEYPQSGRNLYALTL